MNIVISIFSALCALVYFCLTASICFALLALLKQKKSTLISQELFYDRMRIAAEQQQNS